MKKEGLANILHIVQTLAQTASLPDLFRGMAEVCLSYTEADRCLLLENQEGRLLIQAEASVRAGSPLAVEVMQSLASDARTRIKKTFIQAQKLPHSVLETACKGNQGICLSAPFSVSDEYFQHFPIQSLLCIPLRHHGALEGAIYLEIRHGKQPFSEDSEEFMGILSGHFAVQLHRAHAAYRTERALRDATEALRAERERNAQFHQQVQLLGEIGQEIASHFTIESIISSVYANVNTLMDATLFSIGIFNPETDTIDMPGTIEREQRLPPHSYRLDERERLAVWCYTQGREVFINDFRVDYPRYFPNSEPPKPKIGDLPESVVYLPIQGKDAPIGVITVQSFRKYAYSEFHLSMLRNLAIYVAIALENMQAYEELQAQRLQMAEQAEVIRQQKEQVTHAYQDIQLLAELGREITTNLDIGQVVEAAQRNIDTVMDASIFTIGVYHPESNTLEMPLTIEHGEKIGHHAYDLSKDEPRLAVWCFKNEREAFISNYPEEFSQYFPGVPLALPKVGQLPQSVIYLPVQAQGKTIGVITVQSFQPNAYTEYHLNFLRNMAVYVGIALENADAYARLRASGDAQAAQASRLEQSLNSIKLLGEIGQEITANLEAERIIETAYESVNNLMDASAFVLGIYDAEAQELDFLRDVAGGEVQPARQLSVDESDDLAVLAFRELREVVVNDARHDIRKYLGRSQRLLSPQGDPLESMVFLPLIGKSRTVGVLGVQSTLAQAYGDREMSLLRNLAIYVSIALENAEAYERMEEANMEVELQRRLIEQSYRNMRRLADVGQDIMASLDVEKIIATVYESINQMVDASVFWIGIYRPETHTLEFTGGKEKGETLPDFSVSLDKDERLATWCFLQQREVLINNVETDYTKYLSERKQALIGEAPESIIYLPLTVKGKRMGVLTVQSFRPNAYQGHHLEILRNLVNYVFTALENALLYENMEEEVRERTAEVVRQKEEIELQRDQLNQSFHNIKLLSEIGQDITGMRSTEQIIREVYHNVNTLMDATIFGIGILNRETRKVFFQGAMEDGHELPDFYHDADDERRFSGWCLQHRQEVFINDFARDYGKYIPGMKKAAAGREAESILYLPLMTKNGDIGVVTIQSFEKEAYTQYHLEIMRNLAVYVAIAIENSEAYREIARKTAEVEQANLKLTSSINYAKRIQQALLPETEAIRQCLPEFFVFFRPRDIVSGDFYWFKEQHRKCFLAAMDCTGHGVPGAFMSMMGNDLLHEIVTYLNFESPDYILSELHTSVREALRQEQTDSRDGMDIGMCVIDPAARRVYFAGANMPLVHISGGQMQLIQADRHGVGGHQREAFRSFTQHVVDAQPGDTFYLFSDGFQDQFGGAAGRKFLSRNFRQLLLDIHQAPMHEQERLLEEALQQWIGTAHRQIDDVMVMGFRL